MISYKRDENKYVIQYRMSQSELLQDNQINTQHFSQASLVQRDGIIPLQKNELEPHSSNEPTNNTNKYTFNKTLNIEYYAYIIDSKKNINSKPEGRRRRKKNIFQTCFRKGNGGNKIYPLIISDFPVLVQIDSFKQTKWLQMKTRNALHKKFKNLLEEREVLQMCKTKVNDTDISAIDGTHQTTQNNEFYSNQISNEVCLKNKFTLQNGFKTDDWYEKLQRYNELRKGCIQMDRSEVPNSEIKIVERNICNGELLGIVIPLVHTSFKDMRLSLHKTDNEYQTRKKQEIINCSVFRVIHPPTFNKSQSKKLLQNTPFRRETRKEAWIMNKIEEESDEEMETFHEIINDIIRCPRTNECTEIIQTYKTFHISKKPQIIQPGEAIPRAPIFVTPYKCVIHITDIEL